MVRGLLPVILVGLSGACQNAEPLPSEPAQDEPRSEELSLSEPSAAPLAAHPHDVYSCTQQAEAAAVEVCVEVSTRVPGNDLQAIGMARTYCGENAWRPGKACPRLGVRSQCVGAYVEQGFTYDKFSYADGIQFTEECAANGGQS